MKKTLKPVHFAIVAVAILFILAWVFFSNSNSGEEESPLVLAERFHVLYDEGRYVEAIILGDELIEKYPNEAVFYLNRAIAKATLGRFEEAMVDFDKAIELNPRPEFLQNVLIAAYVNRGIAYKDWGKQEAAFADWSYAMELAIQENDSYWIANLKEILGADPPLPTER